MKIENKRKDKERSAWGEPGRQGRARLAKEEGGEDEREGQGQRERQCSLGRRRLFKESRGGGWEVRHMKKRSHFHSISLAMR